MTSTFDDCSALNTLILGEKYSIIPTVSKLPKGNGWVNANTPATIIISDGKFAVIENDGKNTYKQYVENKPNYPAHVTNIKVEYRHKTSPIMSTPLPRTSFPGRPIM